MSNKTRCASNPFSKTTLAQSSQQSQHHHATNPLYYQDLPTSHMQTSPDLTQHQQHQQQQQPPPGSVDLRSYLELSTEPLPLEDEQLSDFGTLNLPLNLQECGVENSELAQYLPQQQQQEQQQQVAQQQQTNAQQYNAACSQWLLNRWVELLVLLLFGRLCGVLDLFSVYDIFSLGSRV